MAVSDAPSLGSVQAFRSMVAAWEAWDRHPGNEDRAVDLSSAVGVVADDWGVSVLAVMGAMQEERRAMPGGAVLAAAQRVQARLAG